MLYCNELIPNIWWIYSNKFDTLTEDEINFINKFTTHHQINNLIKLDDYCSFWNKSNKFILDIKKQLEIHEIKSLKELLNKIFKLVYKNYINSSKTLIFTNNYNEIGYIFWIYFFKLLIDIPHKQIIDSLKLKLQTQIILTEKEKRFLQILFNN